MKWSKKLKLQQFLSVALVTIVLSGAVAPAVMALRQESFFTRNNILFLETDSSLSSSLESAGCSELQASSAAGDIAGSGLSKNLMEIKDPQRFAKAIDDWIRQKYPKSPMVGLGKYAVMGGQRSGINPILPIIIARKESQLGTARGAGRKLTEGHNAYGRTAQRNQPHVATGRLWYKWPSFEDSLFDKTDRKDDMYAYLKRRYNDIPTIDQLMMRYAPPHENNTEQYLREIKSWANEIYALAGDSIDLTKTGKEATYDNCHSLGGNSFGGSAGTVSLDGFTMYYQYKGPWAKQLIGKQSCINSTFTQCGCGPTSLAIVIANLTGDKSVIPPRIRDLAMFPNGISWGSLENVPRKFGLKTQDINKNIAKARDTLRKGGYVIISQARGALTRQSDGHILVIRGMTSDGRFLVADPASEKHTTNQKGYSEQDILNGTRRMWAVTK